MIMTKRDVIELNGILNTLKGFGDTKFKYTILKDLGFLKPYMSDLAEIEKGINEIISVFSKERNDLILELGTKDDKGGIFIDKDNEEVMSIFTSRVLELIEKHQESVTSYNEEMLKFEDILNEPLENEINFWKISIDQLPGEGITLDQLNKLMELNIIND